MSYVWKSHIECDGCGVKHHHLPEDDTLVLRRRSASGAGWIYNSQQDMCPACQTVNKQPLDESYDDEGIFNSDKYFKVTQTL